MFRYNRTEKIKEILHPDYHFYAHPNETITEHVKKCLHVFQKSIEEKEMEPLVEKIINGCFSEVNSTLLQFLKDAMVDVIVFHDLGKINPNFQKLKMKNSQFQKFKFLNQLESFHSPISALIYLNEYSNLLRKLTLSLQEKNRVKLLIVVNSYIIARHHSNLGDFETYCKQFLSEDGDYTSYADIINEKYSFTLQDQQRINFKKIKTVINGAKECVLNSIEEKIALYTYERLLFSLLVSSDYFATSSNEAGKDLNEEKSVQIAPWLNEYNQTALLKTIRTYQNTYDKNHEPDTMNELRSKMFLETEENLRVNISSSVFYLEAPTGAGKSNIALNLSFQLLKEYSCLKKIFYIYPYNTLVEQNIEIIRKIFGKDTAIMDDVAVINSDTPIKVIEKKDKEEKKNRFQDEYYEDEEERICYQKALLQRQFFQYPIILSTHVTLFDILFGIGHESAFGFYQLANSVIVLDEIQSYKNKIWTEIILFLKNFSKLLNIKIIIMSATLPDLDILSSEESMAVKLVTNKDYYFNHHFFKDRVKLDFSLLNAADPLSCIVEMVEKQLGNGKKILIEFIKKKTADEFFDCMKANLEEIYPIEKITGDDNIAERKRIIDFTNSLSANAPLLLIATQVIEAGVDLKTIQIGYKDVSMFDSEEQFLGRINRNANGEGYAYFFNLDDEASIYRGDLRCGKAVSLREEKIQTYLKMKDTKSFYNIILRELMKINDQYNKNNVANFFTDSVGKLNCPRVAERMKLITEEKKNRIFLNTDVIVDGNVLKGEEVWDSYVQLLQEKNYSFAKWKILLSEIQSKMQYFIYEVRCEVSGYSEQVGDLFYFEDGMKYFENGKFNSKAFGEQLFF